jgi:hypothetical protein
VLSPRELAAREGMLAWPKRFPRARVKEYEYELGQYAFAGQYQQSPVPRKGGIFKREYWQPYVVPSSGKDKGKWPDFDFVLVSVDSAFTEKEENDPTGCTTWGVWTDPADGYPKVMLIMAWRKHLPLHGEDQEPQERGETDVDYANRCMPYSRGGGRGPMMPPGMRTEARGAFYSLMAVPKASAGLLRAFWPYVVSLEQIGSR